MKTKVKNKPTGSRLRKWGITGKLVAAIVVTIVIMVAALLMTVHSRVSDTLLEDSEKLLAAGYH